MQTCVNGFVLFINHLQGISIKEKEAAKVFSAQLPKGILLLAKLSSNYHLRNSEYNNRNDHY